MKKILMILFLGVLILTIGPVAQAQFIQPDRDFQNIIAAEVDIELEEEPDQRDLNHDGRVDLADAITAFISGDVEQGWNILTYLFPGQ